MFCTICEDKDQSTQNSSYLHILSNSHVCNVKACVYSKLQPTVRVTENFFFAQYLSSEYLISVQVKFWT